jgi:hypothetical protein
MYHKYDFAGWYTGATDQQIERSTPLAPANLIVTEVVGEMRANWTGYEWINLPYAAPVDVVSSGDVCEWFIDIGPFFDRFGAQKIPVLACADVTVQAILRDVQVRKWVDLKRADVAQALDYISTKVPGVDASLKTAILTTPVSVEENLALRKTYFS